ncbi:putative surface-exposed virulence protein [Salmonella enterica subsp. enterica serovar Alachua str. R6-377]|uniref:Putative surface-exposed virulence protein n=1 Tax=Salmonella enterica subsp. enterica serovar Alachua str. R6-377 TaxID=913241 RepID=G5LUP1_SALET|nr:putative surface-exposed virulence protein [Salmonella enterica subsp. enterica serovar Alachua str. R6-377]
MVIDNAGSTTVSGADATALYIEGDNALVINEGNQTISGGAVGSNQTISGGAGRRRYAH